MDVSIHPDTRLEPGPVDEVFVYHRLKVELIVVSKATNATDQEIAAVRNSTGPEATWEQCRALLQAGKATWYHRDQLQAVAKAKPGTAEGLLIGHGSWTLNDPLVIRARAVYRTEERLPNPANGAGEP